MEEKQQPIFALMMNKLANIYGKQLNQDIIDVYFEILKQYGIYNVGKAFMLCIEQYKHFPKPAQILPECSNSIRMYGLGFQDNKTDFISYEQQEELFEISKEDVKKIR